MVEIPSGKISLRDDRKDSRWDVEIAEFKMARYAVTQDLYFAVTGQNPSVFLADHAPVENVSWHDAIDFCNQLSEQMGFEPCYIVNELVGIDASANGFRLPNEAEWQYACQAGGRDVRYGELHDIAWYEGNSGAVLHDVGQKLANAWGVYDMLGNVWEWCWDVYDAEVYGDYRIFRGGGWADRERSCLATNRRRSHPTYAIDDLGFRVARNL
ncbi:MAG: formylglycine-generating enzyme family protein [Alphaproteobacteria bacterium]|nr:formylglycine-generating enzyme family protein [Alphaproteobacteria bacterium]